MPPWMPRPWFSPSRNAAAAGRAAVQGRVHQPGPLALGGQRHGQVPRDRCLADPALPAGYGDDGHVLRAVGHFPPVPVVPAPGVLLAPLRLYGFVIVGFAFPQRVGAVVVMAAAVLGTAVAVVVVGTA